MVSSNTIPAAPPPTITTCFFLFSKPSDDILGERLVQRRHQNCYYTEKETHRERERRGRKERKGKKTVLGFYLIGTALPHPIHTVRVNDVSMRVLTHNKQKLGTRNAMYT